MPMAGTGLAYERLRTNLEKLKLDTAASILDSQLEIAAKKELSVVEVLDELMEQERRSKDAAAAESKLRFSGMPVRKTLDDFDLSFQPSIDAKVIRDLFTLRFLHNAENVVFLGPPGVGKTHLAIALGVAAIGEGHAVRFANATRLMEALKAASRKDELEGKLANLRKYPLLIIDEIGYLPFDNEGAHCFFQLVSQQYERGSLVITSNKSFGEWGQVFQDNVIASAILDRILHHCTTVSIRGESYRLKNRQKCGLEPSRGRRGRPRKTESDQA